MPPEYVSETREGMDNIADAIRTLAAVFASLAASAHTNNPGDQRNLAMVIFEDATARFEDVHRKVDPNTIKQLETWIDCFCKAKRK
jgi:hypothetical protein